MGFKVEKVVGGVNGIETVEETGVLRGDIVVGRNGYEFEYGDRFRKPDQPD